MWHAGVGTVAQAGPTRPALTLLATACTVMFHAAHAQVFTKAAWLPWLG